MTQKTHVGFNKKGELTSGKCEADKRACPYGKTTLQAPTKHTTTSKKSQKRYSHFLQS